jgi:DNA-binding response OmpR family regulator
MVKVLLAGEQAPFVAALRQRLERMGMTARTCLSGAEVIRAQSASESDAVIADFRLADMDASELCRKLRGAGCHVPVLVHAEAEIGIDAILSYEAGADDYFDQRLDFPVVEAKLRRALRRREQYLVARAAPDSGVWPVRAHAEWAVVDTREFTRFEERLFQVLARARGGLVPVNRISEDLWGRASVEPRALYEHVSTLRSKLRRHGLSVTNERGKGYRLESMVRDGYTLGNQAPPGYLDAASVSPRAEIG